MISLHLRAGANERDALSCELWDAGTLGITEEADGLRAFFTDDIDLAPLITSLAGFQPQVRREQERDWVREAQGAWEPLEVGERFYLVPEWRDDPAPPGRVRLTIHPGMACGTGAAPATQLCLRMLERHVGTTDTLLDVGTGTGILAQAARLLGAGRVWACDIDHEATRIAQRNYSTEFGLFTGSVRAVRSRAADVIVANLNAATLHANASEMRRVLKENGHIIVSGFRTAEASDVTGYFNLKARDTLDDQGWACLLLSDSGSSA